MRRSKIIITMLALAAMSSCLVSSLHPFYRAEDKYFDTTMVGYWIDGDSCIWTILPNMVSEEFMSPEKHDSSYVVTYFDEDNGKAVLTGTLFQLNGVNYVDFVPHPDVDHCNSDMTSYHHVPVHTLARVQYCRDSILMYWYGDDWLNDLFEQNRIRIKHEKVYAFDYDRHVLTAPTVELQKFIKKYANDPKTVKDIEEIFARGDTEDHDFGVLLKLKPFQGDLPDKRAAQVKPG